jgi:putative YhbY family RNA-binding protein
MLPKLPSSRRSELRAEAHKLDPVVIIGDKGLTDEVIAEIDRSLRAHELIKVRAASGEREQRDIWLETICERLQAHPVQQIGKVFVIYREKAEEDLGPGPSSAEAGARGDESKRRPRGEVVGERGKRAQRARDAAKVRMRDIADMKRKGKIPANVKLGPGPGLPTAGVTKPRSGGRGDEATRTSRPRSRTPSPLPASGPRRRRPRTSR